MFAGKISGWPDSLLTTIFSKSLAGLAWPHDYDSDDDAGHDAEGRVRV